MYLLPLLLAAFLPTAIATNTTPLILTTAPNIPALPPSTTAILTTLGHTIKTPITRSNSFVFRNLTSLSPTSSTSYLLDIACRDYDFASYGLEIKSDGSKEIFRVGRGGIEQGERIAIGEGPVELRVLKAREFYEVRGGFNPLDLLKNPMILIAVVGLAFVFGMPYLLDNMDPEMKKEFEEQQKKGIIGSGASGANPLQNFDMAAWMAGKTAGGGSQAQDEGTSAKARKRA